MQLVEVGTVPFVALLYGAMEGVREGRDEPAGL